MSNNLERPGLTAGVLSCGGAISAYDAMRMSPGLTPCAGRALCPWLIEAVGVQHYAKETD
jgi:hypothetical protein